MAPFQRTLSRTGRRLSRGVTLIESAVTAAVLAVATAQAVPAFTSAAHKRHLAGAAAELRTDLQFARMQAVALNHTVRVSLRADVGAGCYVVHTGDAGQCDCAAVAPQPVCTGAAQALRHVVLPLAGSVRLESGNRSLAFEPEKGTVSPTATLRLRSGDGEALHQVVNILGRVRTCAATQGLPGYAAC